MKVLLILFMLLAMPTMSLADDFNHDTVSKKYPLDSDYFAYEASQEIAKEYQADKTQFILIPAKKDILGKKLSSFLAKSGFTLNNATADGIVLSYTFDKIDKQRAYLLLEFSDGNHIGIVRKLGEVSPFVEPADNYLNKK